MKCKICKSKKLIKITNLKNQPISSVFSEKKKFGLKNIISICISVCLVN